MPTRVVSKEKERTIVLFYRASCPFSNFYPTQFKVEIDGKEVKFSCSEQYFMYQKAMLVHDEKSANEILKMTKPLLMKRAGRKLKMDQNMLKQWSLKSSDVMYDVCFEKFSQNEDLTLALFRTHEMLLAEASPRDKLWGIGFGASNIDAGNPKKWKGENKLGKILGKVRDELWQSNKFRKLRDIVEKEDVSRRCSELKKLG